MSETALRPAAGVARPPSTPRKRRRRSAYARRQGRSGLVFVTPFMIIFALFMIAPLGYAIYQSLYTTKLIGGTSFSGFANYGNIPNLWAPDISYFNGLWHLYYAGSSFGSNNSVIGLATTPTLDPGSPRYHWTDDGLVFKSTSSDNYNAIDPSLVTGADGARWLVFGSYWSGIKLIALDSATGKPATPAPTVYSLASKPFPDPEEGAGIVYHDGYYYLFAAIDTCCRGISSTYHIQVGRSVSVTGPYTDAAGAAMSDGGGMEVQGTDAGMIGPGSPFVFATRGGQDWLVYHYYDAYSAGDAWLQIRPLIWVGGWPVTGQPMVPVPGQPGPPGA